MFLRGIHILNVVENMYGTMSSKWHNFFTHVTFKIYDNVHSVMRAYLVCVTYVAFTLRFQNILLRIETHERYGKYATLLEPVAYKKEVQKSLFNVSLLFLLLMKCVFEKSKIL